MRKIFLKIKVRREKVSRSLWFNENCTYTHMFLCYTVQNLIEKTICSILYKRKKKKKLKIENLRKMRNK